MKMLRRLGLVLLVLAVVAAGIFGYARYVEPRLLTTTHWPVTVPQAVQAGKIVFFSDTHFGGHYAPENIEKIVQKINRQQPDVVIFGGDFFDNYKADEPMMDLDYLQSQLAAIQAKHGKFAVYGNHDHGGGAAGVYPKLMEAGGFALLKNESVWIEGLSLRLVCFDDIMMGYTSPELYTLGEGYALVAAHQPDVAQQIALPDGGLMLAGHSHGGQVWLPFVTRSVLPPGATTYTKGEYTGVGVQQNMDLFVSCGIGVTKRPYRFLNTPEIVVAELVHPA